MNRPFNPPPTSHRAGAGYGRILGLGADTIGSGQNNRVTVASSIAQGLAQTGYAPLVSGIMRLWWRVSSVVTAPATATPPRVFIRWSVQDEAARGNLLNPASGGVSDPASANQAPELICDAWYGQIEIAATSAQIQAGFLTGDTPSGQLVVQATITEGGTGSEQYAVFSRHLSIATPPGSGTINVPGFDGGVNNGAHRARSVTIFTDAAIDTTVQGTDWAGNIVQVSRTGAPAPPTPAPILDIALHPSVSALTLLVPAPIGNGYAMFRYF